jgi:diguanylate cyclase (GGDEF)-like protein/PAS domain S-box-containing protein
VDEQRFKSIVQSVPDAIFSSSLDGVIETWNPAATELFGYSAQEAVGMHLLRLVPREQRDEALSLLRRVQGGQTVDAAEVTRLAREGRLVDVSLSLSPLRDAELVVTGIAGVVRDVSSSREAEDQLREMALRDPLTGLYNRRQFEDELDRQLALARRTGRPGVALLIDLDRFKEVNDTLGHAAGDKLLRGVAGVLTQRLRTSDLIARIGGDEFAAILIDVDEDQAEAVARSIEDRIDALRIGDNEALATSASIGVAGFGGLEASREDVLRRADLAMYERKREKVS